MFKLESRLVDDCLIDNRCFSKLNALLVAGGVVRARGQREPADTGYTRGLRVVVTTDERVVLVDLVIDSRAERGTAARNRNSFIETDDIVVCVKHCRDDERLVVDVALIEVNEE